MATLSEMIKKAYRGRKQWKFCVAVTVSISMLMSVSYLYASPMEPSGKLFMLDVNFVLGQKANRVVSRSALRETMRRIALNLIGATKKVEIEDDRVVVETLLMEAVGEGYGGMVAVGEVIRNRSGMFRKDFKSVCLMPKQFSCWNDRERAKKFLKGQEGSYELALKAWKDSKNTSLTKGATDYHTQAIHPYWADAYRVAAIIGNHIFYNRK